MPAIAALAVPLIGAAARAAAPAIGRAVAGGAGKAGAGAIAGGAARMAGSAMKSPTAAFTAGRMTAGGDEPDMPESRNQNFSQGMVATDPASEQARLSYVYGLG